MNEKNRKSDNLYTYIVLFCLVMFTSYLGYKNLVHDKKDTQETATNAVKEYIAEHPEEIISSLQKHHQKQIKQYEELAKATIKEKLGDLESPTSPSYSSGTNPDITIIAFYDASCGYCKTSNKSLVKLLENDDKIKVIYKQFPILGVNSEIASRVLLAVYNTNPKYYYDFNNDIMSQNEALNPEIIKGLLAKYNIGYEQIETEMNNPKVTEELEKVKKLAMDLNIQGTPAYIIGGEFYPGSMDTETLKKIIDNRRKSNK